MTSPGTVLAVCRVAQLVPDPGSVGVTAIDKRPVDGPVKVRPLGLYADVQADRDHHGGPEQAVYAYSAEDAGWWSAELGYDVVPGLFGENLRTHGVETSDAVIGERWRVGTALLEVTDARTPCATFARRLGEEKWVRRFTEANRTGCYLRVLTPGVVQAGDDVVVEHRPEHGVRISDWFRASSGGGDPEVARALLDAHAQGAVRLTDEIEEKAQKALARAAARE
ncbi:MOSC domain-containing protein YiiM [Paraoerskovia marina]|uniref:MOSC domain-containing protein YiiM n=1 Tax=Paraoerskovia marina TaxID=545619 RepID=A0A1H1P0M2_9CELL|nr:MOSC domain-containing protein [Paraoerskovia marina]SDS04744.1 MOSC domain-containing protein YiiM [Paraoerskovia marina]